MIFRYQQHDQIYSVQMERLGDDDYQVTIDDRVYRVQAAASSEHVWRLVIDGQKHTAYAAADRERRWIQAGDQPAVMLETVEQQTRRRSRATGDDTQLNAQMPGQVVEVFVANGDQVTDGQTVMILEAMKMEIRITAPYHGIVRQVNVARGEVVERDQPLIEITATTDQTD